METRGLLTLDELVAAIEAGEIETVITAIPDLYGRLVGKRITGRFFLEETARSGMHVCDYLLACDVEMDPTPGYAYTSWASGYGDLHAVPDLSTLRRAAWHPKTAIVLCDAQEEDTGAPVAVAPRSVLKAQLARAEAAGLFPHMGSELEFFLFRETYDTAREKGYSGLETSQKYVEDYHVLSSTFVEDVIGAIRRDSDASGITVEFSKGEWGPGQHEINLRYAPALEMADRHVLYKLAAKEIAAKHGYALTFMAKWHTDHAGNSLHVHMSFTDPSGQPVFAPEGSPALEGTALQASPRFRHALAGMLAHSSELALLFAPNSNSYKRYQEGTFAPTRVAWSVDNRTVGIRIVGHGPSLRIECRIPGADANPYLVYAGLIAAALDGIERELEPGAPFVGDAYEADGLPEVPRTLHAAVAAFEGSAWARQVFGDAFVDHYLHFARTELREAENAVTDFERKRFFERI